MDEYPTEEEEYELRYNEEMELIDDFDDEALNIEKSQPTSTKIFLNHTPQSVLQSPQLSQISSGTGSILNVNRKLFGTPRPSSSGGAKRISSTPVVKSTLLPISEAIPGPSALSEIQNIGLTRKRRLDDLFGDIQDIEDDDITIDPEAKKRKNKEERDDELIEIILAARRKGRDKLIPSGRNDVEKLNALHAFKMRNLSYSIPNWPFLPVVRSDEERIYVRYHSEEFETKQINEVSLFNKGYTELLGDAKTAIWNEAQEITLKRLTTPEVTNGEVNSDIMEINEIDDVKNDELWVEKYKPRRYIDLLSDESANRSLLYWLKMWDKVVFGREFKVKKEVKPGQFSTFNKKTGKFESTGGWKNRRMRNLNTEFDEIGRPIQKIALLSGPPGLGKTTLAHTIATHAGYQVRELNASDDRSPEAFKLALENSTQMKSMLNLNNKPNCIILDEIDGAPSQSIDFLIKFITDNVNNKGKKGGKVVKNILKRPIICICNDMYVPALRQLRQVAFVVTFPPIDSAKLADRLGEISRREDLKFDLGTLIALAEKSGNDIRSCISMLQFYHAKKKRLLLQDVLHSSFGQKDRHRGLFQVWAAIFQIQRPQKQLDEQSDVEKSDQIVIMSNMSSATRMRHVLDVVHSEGSYERLMQGVYENYLNQKSPDPNMNGIVEAAQWFCFSDMLHRQINQLQNYSVYSYLQFGFVVWHLLFAGLAWPKITFPTKGYEYNQKLTTSKMIFQSFRKGLSSGSIGIGQGKVILIDTVPLLRHVLSPILRSVSLQLLTTKEKYDLTHTVKVMVDLGLAYSQIRKPDGTYQYQLEPNIDTLCHFPGSQGISLNYYSQQLIAREVEMEQMRRATPKFKNDPANPNAKKSLTFEDPKKKTTEMGSPKKKLPNHLQFLQPQIRKTAKVKDVVSKDFFGRITAKSAECIAKESALTDAIVKSPIWYRYKEGFNNAVRRDIYIKDLL